MKRAFDKKIFPQKFYPGDLVLRKAIVQSHSDPRGKWTPNYEGPYIVKRAFSGGALILIDMDGDDLSHPVNADIVKRCYA